MTAVSGGGSVKVFGGDDQAIWGIWANKCEVPYGIKRRKTPGDLYIERIKQRLARGIDRVVN